MKVFIWLFCFFVVAVIQTAAREVGLILGAIPAMLLFGLAWWSAKKLCSLWDQHQAEKAALAVSESPIPDPLPTEQESATSAPAPSTPKLRYCKLCGAPIDPVTRKCTDCRKQYFRPPVLHKKHLAIAAGVLACAAVVFLVFNLDSRLNAAEAKVEELSAQIAELNTDLATQEDIANRYIKSHSSLKSAFDGLQKNYDALRKENAMYREYLDYCEYYCAYVTITGGKISSSIYHRLDCPYTESADSLRILYIEFLESRDFTPCPYCYG